MTRRYTYEEKRAALDTLAANGNDIPATSRATGIRRDTLRAWKRRHDEQRAERLYARIERLHEQLAENALGLAAALERSIESAPLNQVSTALGTLVDRYLKLDEYLEAKQAHSTDERERVYRIEYVYPDNTIHSSPPWARGRTDVFGPFQSSGVRTPVRQDGDGQDDDRGAGAEWDAVLVGRADVPDGEPGLARSENGAGGHPGYGSERNGTADGLRQRRDDRDSQRALPR